MNMHQMENDTLSARDFAVQRNRWVHYMRQPPIWNFLITMLRPMDIVSLAIATRFCVRPRDEQMPDNMKWWRQIFYDMTWVEKNRREIIVVSKDLARFDCAIKECTYFDTANMKLLVMVKETLPVDRRDEARRALLTSIRTPYMWGINTYQVRVNRYRGRDIQTCVIFYNGVGVAPNIYADLSFSWGRSLLEEIPAREPIIVDGDHYYQSSDGTITPHPTVGIVPGTLYERDHPPLQPPWFRVSYADLRYLWDLTIKQTCTRTDYTIATHGEYEFRGYMRIAATVGFVVVPTIRASVARTPAWENYETT